MKQIGKTQSAFGFVDNKYKNREGGMVKSICRWASVSALVCFAFMAGAQSVQAQGCTLPCSPTYTGGGCDNAVPTILNMYCQNETNGIGPSTVTAIGFPNHNNANLVVGQKVFFLAALSAANKCCITGGVVTVVLPDGSTHNFNVGCNELCDGASSQCGLIVGIQTNFPLMEYTVRAVDIGVVRSIAGGLSAGGPGKIGAVLAWRDGFAIVNNTPPNDTQIASGDNTLSDTVLIPNFTVQKDVACTTGTVCDAGIEHAYSDPASVKGAVAEGITPSFCYRVIINNTGTTTLSIDSVSDDTFNTGIGTPFTLVAGASRTNFFGPSPQTEASLTDTLTVQASSSGVGCTSTNLTRSDTATAQTVPSFIKCDVSFKRAGVTLTTAGSGCDISAAPTADPIDVVVTITGTNNLQTLSGCRVVLSGWDPLESTCRHASLSIL